MTKSCKVKRNCIYCGKEFFVIPANTKDYKGKYCSRKCMGKYFSNNKRGEKCSSWKGGLVKKRCVKCGKEFDTRPDDLNRKFCSRECAGNTKKSKKSKKISISSSIRSSGKYKQWQQSVLIRDNFICQECGQVGGDLEVHHKKSFDVLLKEVRKYLPLFNLYNGAMVYTPLWEIDNGITYCKKCHKKHF